MEFQDAVRTKLFLRMALDGAEGSGKSYTAMLLMYYLLGGQEFFLIDAERGRSRLYAPPPGKKADPLKGWFNFKSVELETYDPRKYIEALGAAAKAGAKGILIDGISQAWEGKGGILDQKNQLDKRPNSNGYTNWATMTELQNELIGAMLDFPGHLITTMRSKVDHVIDKNENGKTVIRKMGLQPVQRDGVSYEFDLMARMENSGATMEITKARNVEALVGKTFEKPGQDVAKLIAEWLDIGAEMPMTRGEFISKMNDAGYKTDDEIAAYVRLHTEITGPYKYNELVKAAQA